MHNTAVMWRLVVQPEGLLWFCSGDDGAEKGSEPGRSGSTARLLPAALSTEQRSDTLSSICFSFWLLFFF